MAASLLLALHRGRETLAVLASRNNTLTFEVHTKKEVTHL